MQYLNGATELLSTLDNRMEQEIYAGKLSQEIGVERATVMMQVEKLSKRRHQAQQKKEFREFQQQTIGRKTRSIPTRGKISAQQMRRKL